MNCHTNRNYHNSEITSTSRPASVGDFLCPSLLRFSPYLLIKHAPLPHASNLVRSCLLLAVALQDTICQVQEHKVWGFEMWCLIMEKTCVSYITSNIKLKMRVLSMQKKNLLNTWNKGKLNDTYHFSVFRCNVFKNRNCPVPFHLNAPPHPNQWRTAREALILGRFCRDVFGELRFRSACDSKTVKLGRHWGETGVGWGVHNTPFLESGQLTPCRLEFFLICFINQSINLQSIN